MPTVRVRERDSLGDLVKYLSMPLQSSRYFLPVERNRHLLTVTHRGNLFDLTNIGTFLVL